MRRKAILASLLVVVFSGCATGRPVLVGCKGLLAPWTWSKPCDARPASYKAEEKRRAKEAEISNGALGFGLNQYGLVMWVKKNGNWELIAQAGPPNSEAATQPLPCGGWKKKGDAAPPGRGYVMKSGKLVRDETCPPEFWGEAE